MVEGGGAVVFPVVFCDGEREMNIGNVMIHPSIGYKAFQSIISQKIGISANQITIYLVDGNRSKFASDYHRKTLITGKANFALIARGKECYFLVILKRSRRDRRRKPRQSILELTQYRPGNNFSRSQWPENPFLLRRNQHDFSDFEFTDLASPFLNQIAQPEFLKYEDSWQNFSIRGNYTNLGFDLDLFHRINDNYPILNPHLCKDCTQATNNKESPEVFHLCVYDPITVGFRSPAGPVTPPRKASI